MAAKSANVVARVEPEIKLRAEAVLEDLGLPVSVVINALYRQIILHNGLPFSLNLPANIPSLDTMSREQFDEMMEESMAQAKAGDTYTMDEVAARVRALLQRG